MTQSARRVLVSVILAGVLASQSMVSKAQTAGARQFQRVDAAGPFRAGFVPRAVDQKPVTVVALLGGPSVADAQEAAGRRLTRAEKDALKAQRRAEQAGARASIQGLGGQVLAGYQSALNGIKIRIPLNGVAALRQLPGVVDVKPVATYAVDTFLGVQRIQAPLAWAGVAGVHGENIKVGIIDTGIDYTHANFGGPGTPAAYQAALATDTAPADPALFGAAAPRIKGGTDLVGDNYDANDPTSVPVPDPNPLDCNGHGSHVAGIAGGSGVTTSGTTYTGPYDQLTHSHPFLIGPGVAPKADLYAIRVFGCSGSTNVVNEAIDWAVDNDMDVINMSLGLSFGSSDSADSLAADNAMKAGVTVVISAGNASDARYILGSPGASRKSITVAATDDPAFIRMTNISMPAVASDPNNRTISAINANGTDVPSPSSYSTLVLTDPNGAVSLGCDPAQFVAQGAAGKLVVVQRGVCARVAKAINGQKAGAAAVVMINNATTLPPFEGPINQNPDNGEIFAVTIPFLGVRGTATTANSDGFFLKQRNGVVTTLTEGTPVQTGTAAFSSGGPSLPDGLLKPDIAAPGVNIVSTGVGTGNGTLVISGTSMAAPFVAGTSALVVQAHPTWKPAAIKSAILNSGNAGGLADYIARRDGTGIVNAAAAVGTQAYAFGDKDETTINFGVQEFRDDFSRTRTIKVKNDSRTDIVFNVTLARQSGQPHNAELSASSITVPARGQREVTMTLTVPAATAGDATDFRDVAGLVTFTPAFATSNRGISLNVAYYLVSRVTANVTVSLAKLKGTPPSGTAVVANVDSPIPATADFYAWGLAGTNDHLGALDLRAAGVQSLDAGGGERVLVFAINTFRPWSAINTSEFDVLIDNNGDGVPDFDLFGIDIGLITTGSFTGEYIAAVFDLHTGALFADFDAVAPTDGSTLLLPVIAADVGVTAAAPRFSYAVSSNSVFDGTVGDELPGVATFNAFTPAMTNGDFVMIPAGGVQTVPVSVNQVEFALTPPLGLMVVTQDNKNGAGEANLVKVRF